MNNINSKWPVLLGGCLTSDGHWFIIKLWSTPVDCHEWVCDGYQESSYSTCDGGGSYLYFHMNWGWHETWGGSDHNGWFSFANWTVNNNGTEENYQYFQNIVSEIHL